MSPGEDLCGLHEGVVLVAVRDEPAAAADRIRWLSARVVQWAAQDRGAPSGAESVAVPQTLRT